MFITFEGLDGSGKTTQIQRAAAELRAAGHNVLLAREPGGTAIGDQIRAVLHDLHNAEIHPHTELLLYNASRAQLVAQVLRPHLAAGGLALCDRFFDSTLAYQGWGRGLDMDALRVIVAFAAGGLRPDLTILLDLAPEEALRRRRQASLLGEEWNRLDDMELDFHRRVHAGYRALAQAEPARWAVVDASGSLEAVAQQVRLLLAARVPAPGPKG
ncbi:MAG: dTMP kinase [Aggregatilineales bacterium]